MGYGKSAGGVFVPQRLADTQQVTAGKKDAHYRSREFHPGNPDSYQRTPEPEFLAELERIDEHVAITWHPMLELWQVWQRDPKLGATLSDAEYCKGWQLLFTLRDTKTKGYAPLDTRLFALLYHFDMSRWGGAMGYYNELVRRQEAEEAAVDKAAEHRSRQDGRDLWDHLQPRVGFGQKSAGKKANRNFI